jgi:hypothetical protein
MTHPPQLVLESTATRTATSRSCWIGGLDRRAGSAASTLRPGGRLVVVDLHPCATGRPARSVHAGLSDVDVGPQYFDHPGSYADPQADIGATATVQWAHSLGEVVTAVARAGLRADRLVEHPVGRGRLSGRARRGTDGRCCLAVDDQDLVVLLASEASRPVG